MRCILSGKKSVPEHAYDMQHPNPPDMFDYNHMVAYFIEKTDYKEVTLIITTLMHSFCRLSYTGVPGVSAAEYSGVYLRAGLQCYLKSRK